MANHYQVLGLELKASAEDIKTAYRQAAKHTHPDTGGSPAAMEQINEAYRVLSDPHARSDYDREQAAAHARLASAPSGSSSAQPSDSIREYHRRRLTAARHSAWKLIQNSFIMAVLLGIITRFFASQAPHGSVAKPILLLIGFAPVYCLVVGLVFLAQPQLRLALHDIPYRHTKPDHVDIRILAAIMLASIPLAFVWLAFFSE